MDNHSVHWSRRVQDWFAERSPRLRCVFMPKYAPEINPVELMNKDLKTNWVGHLRPRTSEELDAAVEGYDKVLKEDPDRVRSFSARKTPATHRRYKSTY